MTPEKDKEIHQVLSFLHFCESHDLSIPTDSQLEYVIVEYFNLTHDEAYKIIKIFWDQREQEIESVWKAPDYLSRGLIP